jgi:hypothetical protein
MYMLQSLQHDFAGRSGAILSRKFNAEATFEGCDAIRNRRRIVA